MPRIVAGWAGSLQLAVPGSGTRPTGERTREALFSMLAARDAIEGAAVLDLYAGSGAFGLEAISRGAASAVLVERAPAAAKVIRDNVARLRRAAPGPIEVQVAQQAVRVHLAQPAAPADLVFLDPPYDLDDVEVAADLLALVPRLGPDPVVLLERSSRSAEPLLPAGLLLERTRVYGDTAVHVLRRT